MKDRLTLMSIGMTALILGNAARFLIHPTGHVAQDLLDGIIGVFFGIAIGCNLLSLRRSDRQSA